MKLLIIILSVCMTIIATANLTTAQPSASPTELRKLAADYYDWRNLQFPVVSSDAGLHTWDHKLTDYGLSALLARRLHV
ncbi:MAG TPA: hypothetical protein VK475_10095, partial [Pyrinomonadaceae bacterium]|nr:hypothetical protein [Pyrinomonadaceae bacterium]